MHAHGLIRYSYVPEKSVVVVVVVVCISYRLLVSLPFVSFDSKKKIQNAFLFFAMVCGYFNRFSLFSFVYFIVVFVVLYSDQKQRNALKPNTPTYVSFFFFFYFLISTEYLLVLFDIRIHVYDIYCFLVVVIVVWSKGNE